MSTNASGPGPGALLGSGASALAGGSLAVAVLHVFGRGPGAGIELLLVLVAAVVAITITWFILRAPRTTSPSSGPAGRPPPGAAAHAFQPGPPVPPFAPPTAPHHPVAPSDTATAVTAAIPATLDIPLGDVPWWNSAVSAPDAGPAGVPGMAARGPSASAAPVAADVAVRDQPRQVVQCPHCGDFRVDVSHRAPGFDLACTRCSHRWFWQAGAPWPRTVVHPQ